MSNVTTGQISINQVSIERNGTKIGNILEWNKNKRKWNRKYENGTKLRQTQIVHKLTVIGWN